MLDRAVRKNRTRRLAAQARLVVSVGILLLAATSADAASARNCTPSEKAVVLAPATASQKSVRLTCSLTLGKGERVTKQIRIRGAEGSGVKVTCRGGVIGKAGRGSFHYRKDIIKIRSVKLKSNRWSRPENVVIDGCKVNGAIRILGLGPNGQAKRVTQSSRNAKHTEIAQAAAPRGIVLKDLTVRGDGRIPVYFAPGVTHSKLLNSRITGTSVSSGVYLDAESAHNTIRGNVFSVRTPREVISIDGSARNVVENNRFELSDQGGIYVYRNCGEGGAARHQEPMFNLISGNTFFYKGSRSARPTIWLSFSNIQRKVFLCPLDRAIPYCSGADDRNFANRNTVNGNTFVNSPTEEVIRDQGLHNKIRRNRRVRQ